MVEDLKIADAKNVGYYSGLIESAFAFTQFLTILQWGRASDRIGRRPILITGLSGVSISILVFGFSRNLPMMIAARCIAGALSLCLPSPDVVSTNNMTRWKCGCDQISFWGTDR